jgi:hypothetical protein
MAARQEDVMITCMWMANLVHEARVAELGCALGGLGLGLGGIFGRMAKVEAYPKPEVTFEAAS